jgi:EAL domain-containing protein (putative c-di-GMP-specific phosphodiesterase class I)
MPLSLKKVNNFNFDLDTVKKNVSSEHNKIVGHFNDLKLSSVFQPIFSIAHKRVVGYEALIRGQDKRGMNVSPVEIFSIDKSEEGKVLLDRLCRYIYMGNFLNIKDEINWLYLNVSPSVVCNGLKYGSFFKDLLEEYGFPPSRIVIEIVEHPIHDEKLLLDTVDYYRELGCVIAIDDFGAGYSNFERIWELAPHIVKLDRSMIVEASQKQKIHDLFPGIVSLLHQAGSLVLAEGVETEEQAIIAMDSDVDFAQGYFFSEPKEFFKKIRDLSFDFDSLFDAYKSISISRETKHKLTKYKELINNAVAALQGNQNLGKACEPLMHEKSVIRCYLLLPDGRQIEKTVTSGVKVTEEDPRFRPLEDAKSADWFRRHYLRRAVMHPDQIQVSRPYLSIAGGYMCTTLSIMFLSPHGHRVFCCDVNER